MAKAKSKKAKRKINSYLIIGISIVIVIYSLYSIISMPLETKTVDVKFSISDKYGINLNSNELDFGKLVPGSSITRNIDLSNNKDFRVNVKLYASKNIADFIYSNEEIYAESGQTISIPVTLIIPSNSSYGNYSGKIRIEMRKA